MSESLKSWLFAHTTTQANLALESNYDLHDMPFLPGNRIQLLRFLTFRPPASPNSTNTDVWALVGDRSHCIAARFARDQVNRFHLDHAVSFTSLKGALVTLTNVRVTVARVQVESGTCAYRHGQYAVVLDVRGWEVVGGVNEVVWFGGVKLVTSRNGVAEGEGERWEGMVRWMKKWVRYKAMMRRAREEQKRVKRSRHGDASAEAGPSASTVLPTPGQGGKEVMGTSQVQNSQPPPATVEETKVTQEQSFPTTTMCSTQAPAAQTDGADPAPAMWTDFDLDADVDIANLDVLAQWNLSAAPTIDAGAVSETAQIVPVAPSITVPPTQQPLQAPPPPPVESQQTSTQTQTQSNLDPDESGLSDYERESRRRKRQRGAPLPRSTTDDAVAAPASCEFSARQPQESNDNKVSEPSAVTPAEASVPANTTSSCVHPEPKQPPTAPVEAASPKRRMTQSQLEHRMMRALDRQRHASSTRSAAPAHAVSKDSLPKSAKKADEVTTTAPDAASSTKRRRQAALAALMAQIVD